MNVCVLCVCVCGYMYVNLKIVEAKNHDQYLVKLDGSNRVTLRNRKFIRKADAPSLVIPPPIDSCPTLVPEATSDEPQNQTPLTDTSCQPYSSNTLPQFNPDHSESDRQNVVDQPLPLMTVEPTTTRPKRMRNRPNWHHDYEMNSISNS